ncbi:MAG: 4Fe-4S dicluster domain-containing protein [Deltaproteobacteria bacterium]|nr:4Fe-4S dicluster domain-containing protein [Deltaproteobacteria bacterium]MBN2673517.1 4Fe-4S dicluster domain-containing protein [Deltaproteobacteria bacterium]
MAEVLIKKEACRGCQICVEVCPTEVLAFDEAEQKAVVKNATDCIACLSCTYICPSTAISQQDFHSVKNFYRDLDFSVKAKRYL